MCQKCHIASDKFKQSCIKGGRAKKPNNRGLRDGGGRTKVYEYISDIAGIMKLNRDEIKLAKIFDKLKIDWKRNQSGFEYIDKQNEKHKYHPDFYLINFNTYVEYKGWVTDTMSHKMKDAVSRNNLNLLIVYSMDKRYKNLGLNIQTLIKNPLILYKYI